MERPKLIEARVKKHWTRAQAAERLGIGASTLIRREKGTSRPYAHNIQRIRDVYGTTAWEEAEDQEANALLSFPSLPEEYQASDILLHHLAQQDITLRLITIVLTWSARNAQYHELQARLISETEEDRTLNQDTEHLVNRRDALRRLALLPIELCGLSALGPVLSRPAEDILTHCAAGVTACWYLRKGKELSLAASIVAAYIPTLKVLAASSSAAHRQAAADLLAQCFLLKSTLSRHLDGSNNSIMFAQQAEKYSEIAENVVYQILSLRTLASVHYYANHWEQALQIAEKAKYLLDTTRLPIPKLVYSYVYAGLATYQACNGQKQQAMISLNKAHTTFFSQSAQELSPIWIDHNNANLLLNDGMAHAHLGLQKEALDSLAQLERLATKSETIRVETFIDQVMAEISRDDQPRDMEWCIEQWKKGIEGAHALQSEQRFNEAIAAYTAMRAAWPAEKCIKDLRELIVHW